MFLWIKHFTYFGLFSEGDIQEKIVQMTWNICGSSISVPNCFTLIDTKYSFQVQILFLLFNLSLPMK